MSGQASFALRGRNPDVLTCIANLSNDEVFTPPEFANRMLDTLAEAWAADNGGANIWADRTVRFLDPCTKSGVFLREITSRLTEGLADEIPDLEERVDHILTKQVFGIGITHLTSLLARRSVYCSKHANGKHSIAKSFASDAWQHLVRAHRAHVGGRQVQVLRREPEGARPRRRTRNPRLCVHPHRRHQGSGRRVVWRRYAVRRDHRQPAVPAWTTAAMARVLRRSISMFVEQAKALDPRYLSMVIPARWFAGGKGLDEFRESMLTDNRLRSIDDYLSASDVFPGVGLKGGVCYFLWDRDNPGPCRVTTHFKDWPVSTATRPLLEEGADVFIRFNEGLSILKKVIAVESGQADSLSLPENKRFDRLVSSRKPFGLETTFKGKATKRAGDVLVYQNGGTGYIARSSISTGTRTHRQVEDLTLAELLREPATETPTRTGSSARHSSGSRAASLQRPISASARSTRRVRPKASCPTSPVG